MKKTLFLSFFAFMATVSFGQTANNSFSGVGMQFRVINDTVEFTLVLPDGPAGKAGLKEKDRLLSVDGKQVTGIGIKNEDILNILRGKQGTKVIVKVERLDKVLDLVVERDVVSLAQYVSYDRINAEQGNAYAQYDLGYRYYHGLGVSKDRTEAVNWYRKAAEQRHADAQNFLGHCYSLGEGVSKDDNEAVNWYRKAAEQGHAGAQRCLGHCYSLGKGVSEDDTEAVNWYRKAAEQGDVYAQYDLGHCYYHGEGVSKDYTEALNWYRKAAEQGFADAQYNLGNIYYEGIGIEKDNAMALYWYRKASLKKMYLNENVAVLAEKRTKEIKITLPNKFSEYAKTYVQNRINEWQQKGEYEKTADWQTRVNELTRKERINALAKEAGDIYVMLKHEAIELSLDRYDADNEVYLIRSKQYGNLLVPVPAVEAQAFKASWNSMEKTPQYFIENDRMALAEVSFTTASGESYTYSNKASLNYAVANIDYNFAPIEINLADNSNDQKGKQNISTVNLNIGKSDIDVNIPVNNVNNDKTFAVVIVNENYQRESQVEFARNDGETFRKYCVQTLGLPEKNVHYTADATLNNIRAEINWLGQVANAYTGEANIIFYYAGHGIPDESSKTAYLLPIDGYGSDVTTGYKLDDLYQKLGDMSAKSVTVFMDACFSGAQRSGTMLASARGVAIKTEQGKPSGNTIVFSAAQGDETAYPYREKGHGLFTYFLLKKLQESKGETTLGELGNYIAVNVQQQSIVVNRKSQTPTVIPSASLANWQSLKLK